MAATPAPRPECGFPAAASPQLHDHRRQRGDSIQAQHAALDAAPADRSVKSWRRASPGCRRRPIACAQRDGGGGELDLFLRLENRHGIEAVRHPSIRW